MKITFKPGVMVRFAIPDGALAVITDFLKSPDWRVPGYLGEGFYLIRTVPEQREMVAHEDDLILAD